MSTWFVLYVGIEHFNIFIFKKSGGLLLVFIVFDKWIYWVFPVIYGCTPAQSKVVTWSVLASWSAWTVLLFHIQIVVLGAVHIERIAIVIKKKIMQGKWDSQQIKIMQEEVYFYGSGWHVIVRLSRWVEQESGASWSACWWHGWNCTSVVVIARTWYFLRRLCTVSCQLLTCGR